MLKVWIPGTTDTRDQGLGGTEFVNDNVTIVANGKLGNCLSFNGSNSRLSTTGFSLSNKWSFSVWIKCNSASSGWMEIWSLGDNNDANRAAAFVVNPSESRIQVSSNGTYNSLLTMRTPTEWNHYAGSWDGSHFVYYINGTYINTYTYTTTHLVKSNLTIGAISTSESGGGHISIRLPFNGLMNYLRIWDNEVISAKEVELLSRGLVCHYPLSREGFGCDNLLPKTSPSYGLSTMTSYGNGTISVETTNTYHGHNTIKVTPSSSSTSSGGLNDYNMSVNLTSGTTYTYSCMIYSTVADTFAFNSLGHYQTYVPGTAHNSTVLF